MFLLFLLKFEWNLFLLLQEKCVCGNLQKLFKSLTVTSTSHHAG